MDSLKIIQVEPSDPRVLALMEAQQAELRQRYNDEDDSLTEPFDPQSLDKQGSALLAAQSTEDNQLLACGAIKKWDNTTAEIKRMYTLPTARGKGLAKKILQGLIDKARELGYSRLVLETGDQQPEAIALYEKMGFQKIPNFGYYIGIESSLCYELTL